MANPAEWQQWHDPEDHDFVLWRFGDGNGWSIHSTEGGWCIRPPLSGWLTAPEEVFVDLDVAKVWVELEASNN